MIRNKSEFLPAVEDAVRNSRSSRAILEDYMEGPEFSIDALVYKKQPTITGFADRHIFYQPYFIETGHTIPTNIDEKKRLELINCFAKAVAALGLTCGAAKADIKYTENGPMVGEIAARLSGGYMSGWTYPFASDLDLTEQALLIALGKEPGDLLLRRKPLPIKDAPFGIYEVPCVRTSAERAWVSIPGRVANFTGTDFVSAMPYTRNILIRNYIGSVVNFPRNNVEKCGNIIAVALKRELAVNAAENGVSGITMRLQKNNAETDRFLAGAELPSEKGFPPDAFELSEQTEKEFEKFLEDTDDIQENVPITPLLPNCLKKVQDTVKDWNHRSIAKTVWQFDKMCANHPKLDGKKFWRAFVRGGLQGIIYVSDCSVVPAKKNTRSKK